MNAQKLELMLPNFSRQMHSLCYATSTKHCTALHWCCTGEFQKVGNAKQHFEHLPGHFQCTRTWRDAPWPLESSTLLCIVPMVFKMRHCSLFIFLSFCLFVGQILSSGFDYEVAGRSKEAPLLFARLGTPSLKGGKFSSWQLQLFAFDQVRVYQLAIIG